MKGIYNKPNLNTLLTVLIGINLASYAVFLYPKFLFGNFIAIVNFCLCCLAITSLSMHIPSKELYSKIWIWGFLILAPFCTLVHKVTGILTLGSYRLNLFGTVLLLILVTLGLYLARQVQIHSKESLINQKKDVALFISLASMSFILVYLERIIIDQKLNPFDIICIILLAFTSSLGLLSFRNIKRLKLTIIVSTILGLIISFITI